MNPQDQPRFEERVRAAAGSELNRYLSTVRTPDGLRTLVRVLVRTSLPLSPTGSDAVRETLEELRRGDVSLQLHFEVATGLPDNYDVRCEPVSNLLGPGEPPAPRRPRPAGQDRLLTLSFLGLRFDYLFPADDTWHAVERPEGRRGKGFVLPQSMSPVPAGPLLELRLAGGVLLARRTWERPDLAVWVNGVLLVPTAPDGVRCAAGGRIAYHRHSGELISELDYDLVGWARGTLSPPGPADPGTGATHDVWLTTGNHGHVLRIAPPSAGELAVDRRFPIPGATTSDRHYLDVQVLYTEGVRQTPEPDTWHVKIYRCATPQHADQLRRYLRTQAALVDKVNAAVGGTARTPPWAIAPISLPPPGSGVLGERRATEYASPQQVSDDPENRLSAWFGVHDRPQPNCFVIAASPMLRRVGWSESYQRGAPGLDQVDDLMALAAGLDQCHRLDIAHCDIKPANICRYRRADDGSGYVLIDGDAVSRRWERLVDLRLTTTYASPRILAKWYRPHDETTEVDLREHDRFGFALVVLAAVAGQDRAYALLTQDEDGARPIDQPEIVTAAIASYWKDPRWAPFAQALAAPFQYDALVGDDWTAVGWLRLLGSVTAAPVDPQVQHPVAAPVFAGAHSARLVALRTEIQAAPPALNAAVATVLRRVATEQVSVARAAYWRALCWGLLPLLAMVVTLIGVIVGNG
ncbi:hypothetical protein [Actinokineospora sp. NBRC 105648]|uniref:hypothetical protein n=1 Tax=Actinokineospora sp. NBRC 105648 TaxID=3032206 RepID=UPI0024A457C4|nr:hypothetical protein [Actinokineospora sp. NBRC 105648]GLZ40800.1 hypothetical protein Acsp05_44240 [Actinokineospora sp. NBRC 105648]